MTDRFDDEEFEAVVSRLRAERAQMTPLELDSLKRRVMRRPTTPRKGAHSVKSRLTTLVTVLSLVGGAGGAIAVAANGGPGSGSSSADAQYNGNGKKCGIPGSADPSCPKHNGGALTQHGHHHTGSMARTVSDVEGNLAFDRSEIASYEKSGHPNAASVKATLAYVLQDVSAAKALGDSGDQAALAALVRQLQGALARAH